MITVYHDGRLFSCDDLVAVLRYISSLPPGVFDYMKIHNGGTHVTIHSRKVTR